MSLQGRHILLGVTGGIAAYKTPEIVRLLTAEGAEVRVVLTRAAGEFVAPKTLEVLSRHVVYSDLFGPRRRISRSARGVSRVGRLDFGGSGYGALLGAHSRRLG